MSPFIESQIVSGSCIGEGATFTVASITDEEAGVDPESIRVFLGGIEQGVSVNYNDAYYKSVVVNAKFTGLGELGQTVQVLRIEVSDRAGNFSYIDIDNIQIDLEAPILQVNEPSDGSVVDLYKIGVNGIIMDNLSSICGLPEVRVNGELAMVELDGRWYIEKQIQEDSNTIMVEGKDRSGIVTAMELIIYKQPEELIGGIQAGGFFAEPVAPYIIESERFPGLRLLLNGEPYEPGTPIEEDGYYMIEFRGDDEHYWYSGIKPIQFVINRTPPEIIIDSTPGHPPYVDVVDENPDPEGLEVYLDGKLYLMQEPLLPGRYSLYAKARDISGNISEKLQEINIEGCFPGSYIRYVKPKVILSAMHYYPWYTSPSQECYWSGNDPKPDHWWCDCIWGPKPQNPRTWKGFYDSIDQNVVKAQIDQMISKGVDVISVEWTGNKLETDVYENIIVPAVQTKNVKIVLLYDTAIRFGNDIDFNKANKRNKFINDFAIFASSNKYFKNSKYLKFGNKPVVYIYVSRAIEGSNANIESAFNAIVYAAVQNGFSGLYIVADHLYWGTIDWEKLDLMKVSAVSSFAPVDISQKVESDPACSKKPVRVWANKLSDLYLNTMYVLPNKFTYSIDIEPGIFVQYDDTGLNTAACNNNRKEVQHYRLCDGYDWDYMIKKAGMDRVKIAEEVTVYDDCSMSIYSPSNYTGIIWVYSYNEWWEGAGSEQLNYRQGSWPYGFELQVLDILKGRLP